MPKQHQFRNNDKLQVARNLKTYLSYALANPWAVMIKTFHAVIADRAV
jgi:hypothetical protein